MYKLEFTIKEKKKEVKWKLLWPIDSNWFDFVSHFLMAQKNKIKKHEHKNRNKEMQMFDTAMSLLNLVLGEFVDDNVNENSN